MDGGLFTDFPSAVPGACLPPLIADSFAGGGGASTGIEMALGRSPDVAINHDEMALAMHGANHPDTRHLTTSVYAIDPRDLVRPGQRVGLAWFSPDCKHHSKAKGGKPLEKNIRDLAWVVVHWAELVRPEVILLENVEEFQDWCPLGPDHRPIADKRGATFREWCARLRKLGYKVEWRELRACDYGAPTIRKRLFVVARCDGRPIVWPTPTHGAPDSDEVRAGQLKPWRTAAEIIDWSIPCPSIFDTSEEIMAKHGVRSIRPLADNTLRRVARGVQRYVLDAAEPFIVSYYGKGAGGETREHSIHSPATTMTTANRHGLIVPTLVQTGYGEREGQAPRSLDLHKPIGTMVAGGAKHALVAAFLAQHNGGERMENATGRAATVPLSTLTTRGTQQNVVAASMVNLRGTADAQIRGRSIEAPLQTLTSDGTHAAVVAAHIMTMRNSGKPFTAIDEPTHTITAEGAHLFQVAAFMTKYYGQGDGQSIGEPCHTLTTRDRFGIVTVNIAGEPYAIVDIGMRMLTPREQFRAQGFPDSYVIDRGADGRPMPKTHQTQKCGNSVCPPLAAALVRANCAHLAVDCAKEAAA